MRNILGDCMHMKTVEKNARKPRIGDWQETRQTHQMDQGGNPHLQGRTTSHEPGGGQLPTQSCVRLFSSHICYLLCQEPDEEVMFLFFWWWIPVEVETSRYIILLVPLMNFNLYKCVRPNESIRCWQSSGLLLLCCLDGVCLAYYFQVSEVTASNGCEWYSISLHSCRMSMILVWSAADWAVIFSVLHSFIHLSLQRTWA